VLVDLRRRSGAVPRRMAAAPGYDPDNLFTCHHCVGSDGAVP
jgi:hypothetical protein